MNNLKSVFILIIFISGQAWAAPAPQNVIVGIIMESYKAIELLNRLELQLHELLQPRSMNTEFPGLSGSIGIADGHPLQGAYQSIASGVFFVPIYYPGPIREDNLSPPSSPNFCMKENFPTTDFPVEAFWRQLRCIEHRHVRAIGGKIVTTVYAYGKEDNQEIFELSRRLSSSWLELHSKPGIPWGLLDKAGETINQLRDYLEEIINVFHLLAN